MYSSDNSAGGVGAIASLDLSKTSKINTGMRPGVTRLMSKSAVMQPTRRIRSTQTPRQPVLPSTTQVFKPATRLSTRTQTRTQTPDIPIFAPLPRRPSTPTNGRTSPPQMEQAEEDTAPTDAEQTPPIIDEDMLEEIQQQQNQKSQDVKDGTRTSSTSSGGERDRHENDSDRRRVAGRDLLPVEEEMKVKPTYQKQPLVLDLPNEFGDVWSDMLKNPVPSIFAPLPTTSAAPVASGNGSLFTPRNIAIGAVVPVGGYLL